MISRHTTIAVAGTACALAAALQVANAQSSPSKIEFKTVAAALEALKAKPNVQVTTTKSDGWTIVNDAKEDTQWSFTPRGHYAHPAVVKRMLRVREDKNLYVEMSVLCEAEKEPCDRLVEEFKQLNERMRQAVQRKLQQGR